MNIATLRKLALALPGTVEQDHHGRPSFRVDGKIFATLPDKEHVNVMVDEDLVDMAIATAPEFCEKLYWGKRLFGVTITLAAARQDFVSDLLREAWRRKAKRGTGSLDSE